MHKCNVRFNALQHGHLFVNKHLLLVQQLRAWPVQQDDDRSETANTGTCEDDLKPGQMVGNVDRQKRNIGTGDNVDIAVVDRQVANCTRSHTIDDVISGVA